MSSSSPADQGNYSGIRDVTDIRAGERHIRSSLLFPLKLHCSVGTNILNPGVQTLFTEVLKSLAGISDSDVPGFRSVEILLLNDAVLDF